MRLGLSRVLCILAAGLWLAGCQTDQSFSDLLSAKTPAAGLDANASVPAGQPVDDNDPPPLGLAAAQEPAGVLGSKAYDDLSIGKRYYRVGNYGMAERYFRQAVETHARDAEAWLGLAAACDRLRRFDLADRAYGEAIKLVGPTVEILNNQGYSYMLRGDYARARTKLVQARGLDPANRYVQNNLRLLATTARTAKAVE